MAKRRKEIKTFNWGPCVIKFKIKPEYAKTIIRRS